MLSPEHLFRGIITTFLFIILVGAVTSGCGRKEVAEIIESEGKEIAARGVKYEEALARIGEGIITVDDYKEELAMLPASSREAANLYKNQFLESLINKRLLLQEAKRKDLENSESVKSLFRKIKEEILIQQLVDKEIAEKAEVSDEEIDLHYSENQDYYMEPAKICASHILVDSEIMAKKILIDLREGLDFSELAQEYSLDIPTKDKGGDVGYFTKGTLLPEFEEACEELEIGKISDVVKTVLGYHIIKVIDKKAAAIKAVEEVRDDIRSELLLDKEIELYNDLLQELRERQAITINNDVLEGIDLNTGS